MTEFISFQKIILVLALVIIWSLESVIPFIHGRSHRLPHAVRNLGLGLFNAVVSGFLMLAFISWAENWQFGLLRNLSLPDFAKYILAIFLLDGWMYIWHRTNHAIPFLWSLHRTHHADREMDVTTAVRFHSAEVLISTGLRFLFIALLGLSLPQILLYDTLLVVVIFLHHSNINFPNWLDNFLQIFITTPALHRVHHSILTSETNSNFGSVFSFWDRIAKTFHLRGDTSLIVYGVEISEE
jgi:sterol desaturase/sphingolipid hydroxylase (fatty acid hydroxylase superfamily)